MPDIAAARPIAGAPIESAWGGQVHDLVEGVQSGTASVVNTAGNGQVSVTFPRPYAAPPNVVACPAANSFYFAGVVSVTATGCVLFARDIRDAQTGTATTPVQWIAVGTPA